MEINDIWGHDSWEKFYRTQRMIQIKPLTGFFASYDIFLCDSILEKYLPKYSKSQKKKLKICEIGCGDGRMVKKIADKFNYAPYGVEYSKTAAKQSRRIGVNVIEGDVFSKALNKKYANYFDIIYSYGFIEHIIPPENAIKTHLNLLKKNGTLVIQIPRFKGFTYWKVKIFRPSLFPLHNLEIMESEKIHSLMKKFKCRELICKNYGTFKLRLPPERKDFSYYVLKAINLLDYIINPLLRLFFKDRGFETNFFSPSIIYIGKKTS